jgi:DivIVA domain-containing protein
MADPHTSDPMPHRFERDQRPSEQLANVTFPLAVRGYDRRAVDDFVESVRSLVADLEARQTREGVVQKALDELGEETAGILQRAHETADEIASRSRAQADGRLQRAEREAELVRREADEYSEQVVTDTRILWDERQRLIEDLRQLADEVLGTADDALERLKLPDPLAVTEQEGEPTTAEEAAGPIPHPLSLAREPDPGIPYDLEVPPAEQDPEATEAWPIDAEQDPDATQAYEVEEAAEDEDSGTVELEALPGGNAEEQQATERERD